MAVEFPKNMTDIPRFFTDLLGEESSHDFCEHNYEYVNSIAEMWNVLSSVPIVVGGVLSWRFLPKALGARHRHKLNLLAMAVNGIGSMAFHGTLLRLSQALDEIPMLLANIVLCYSIYTPGTELAALKYAMYAAAVLVVFAYLYNTNYLIFFCLVFLPAMYQLAYFLPRILRGTTDDIETKLVRRASGFILSGFAVWVWDHAMCAEIRALHLHIWWHVLAGYGVLNYFLLHQYVDLRAMGLAPSTRLRHQYGGFLPYLKVEE